MDTTMGTIVLNEFLESLRIHSDPDNPIWWNLDIDTFYNHKLLAGYTGYYGQEALESP
jgi:hypothetical protein